MSLPLTSTSPVTLTPLLEPAANAIEPPKVNARSERVTTTLTTLARSVPLPPATVQVKPAGALCTAIQKALPDGKAPNVKLAFPDAIWAAVVLLPLVSTKPVVPLGS